MRTEPVVEPEIAVNQDPLLILRLVYVHRQHLKVNIGEMARYPLALVVPKIHDESTTYLDICY